jgi:hypothetical protein
MVERGGGAQDKSEALFPLFQEEIAAKQRAPEKEYRQTLELSLCLEELRGRVGEGEKKAVEVEEERKTGWKMLNVQCIALEVQVEKLKKNVLELSSLNKGKSNRTCETCLCG